MIKIKTKTELSGKITSWSVKIIFQDKDFSMMMEKFFLLSLKSWKCLNKLDKEKVQFRREIKYDFFKKAEIRE